MRLPSRQFASTMLAASVMLSACGGGNDADDASGDTIAAESSGSDTTLAETTTTAEETTTTAEETTTTVEETTTTAEETTTTVATPVTLAGPADGALFTDIEGQYSLLTGPTWSDGSEAFPDGIQGWFTGNDTETFSENVNIVTNPVPSTTPLDMVVSASIETLESTFTDFTLIDSGVLPGANHPELGFLEYTAVQDGVTIRFLQTFGLWNDTLVVFTGSTDADGGEAALRALLDYALTIAPPAGS